MITRETDYAIRAVLELVSRARGRSAAELARATRVPYPFMRRVLGKLTAAKLVRSSRGRSGGVQLVRPAREISLLDVARAIDPHAVTLNACLRKDGSCSRLRQCTVHEALARVQQDLWQGLATITFDALTQSRVDAKAQANKRKKI